MGGPDTATGRPGARHQRGRVPRPPAPGAEALPAVDGSEPGCKRARSVRRNGVRMNHMERLRNAAPRVPTPAIDRELLFNRIVARPGDPGSVAHARRPGSGRRKLTIALIAFALAALTAGTA